MERKLFGRIIASDWGPDESHKQKSYRHTNRIILIRHLYYYGRGKDWIHYGSGKVKKLKCISGAAKSV